MKDDDHKMLEKMEKDMGCDYEENIVERFQTLREREQVYYFESGKKMILFCAINDVEAIERAKGWVPTTYNGHLSVAVFRVHTDLRLELLDGWTPCNQNQPEGCAFDRRTGWFHDGQGYDLGVGSEFEGAWKRWLKWLKKEKILEKKEGL